MVALLPVSGGFRTNGREVLPSGLKTMQQGAGLRIEA